MNIMDRISRCVVAIALLAVVIYGAVGILLSSLFILLSILFVVAGISGFCPFYKSINVDFNNSDEYFK
ncbi:YgaP-like transmembrane domain [Dokdonia sp.]|uniref:YgaP-like transmembrane domain n=1 Tax=Dokdonia sp. TaxID=2024995 RepID=UPI0032664DAD